MKCKEEREQTRKRKLLQYPVTQKSLCDGHLMQYALRPIPSGEKPFSKGCMRNKSVSSSRLTSRSFFPHSVGASASEHARGRGVGAGQPGRESVGRSFSPLSVRRMGLSGRRCCGSERCCKSQGREPNEDKAGKQRDVLCVLCSVVFLS